MKITNNLTHLAFVALCFFLARSARSQQIDFDDIAEETEAIKSSISSIVETIIIVFLILGLGGVIWQYQTNGPEQGKKWLFGWIIGLVVYVVGWRVLGL